MKIVNYIFSIYLIMLSCLPCADMEIGSPMDSSKEITSKNENHSHDKDNDTCSPFCVCNCCGSQGFVSNIPCDFLSFKNSIDTRIPEYKSTITCNYFGSIWQPPQINAYI